MLGPEATPQVVHDVMRLIRVTGCSARTDSKSLRYEFRVGGKQGKDQGTRVTSPGNAVRLAVKLLAEEKGVGTHCLACVGGEVWLGGVLRRRAGAARCCRAAVPPGLSLLLCFVPAAGSNQAAGLAPAHCSTALPGCCLVQAAPHALCACHLPTALQHAALAAAPRPQAVPPALRPLRVPATCPLPSSMLPWLLPPAHRLRPSPCGPCVRARKQQRLWRAFGGWPPTSPQAK